MSQLSIQIAGIKFQNPIFVSSGTFGYGDELSNMLDINKLGAIVTKTLTIQSRNGNPAPRVTSVTGGMFNSVGLQNIGIDKFISDKLPQLKSKIKIPLIISIMGQSVDEFSEITERIPKNDLIYAIELNLSCPNIKAGGVCFSTDPKLTFETVKSVKNKSLYPVFAKLTPNVTDIVPIALAAESAGADAIVAVNTFLGMSLDIDTFQSRLGTATGGISGPAIKPMALYLVYQICRSVKIPVIGMGGIISASDAIEYILAGASAISIGTGNFIQPDLPLKILHNLKKYLKKKNIDKIELLRGQFQSPEFIQSNI